ncbi:DEAD/DEAH box helicase [Rhodotorula toruloides ATCC 204091]|uniref:DEAD/DEAH box helicase n=1 Tax=Rhodotorula toruloides TaxID=5286 RepID=A0A2S9ZW14_RHOTO|nr:DEAD/DEAH box helicase [Rhodotorula toruloides ATCC 204091]KAK4331339.1 DEAD/DEAH box helicase [Rhodotorula toruloides]PRQ69940.1 DEAD/DEAH box helicase [Rhodotorula toruloides]
MHSHLALVHLFYQTIWTLSELPQCVTQATWDSDSPLKQIPHFSSEVIQHCQAANVNSVYDLLELEDTDRDKILQFIPRQMRDVAAFANRYPSVEVSYDIEDQDELSAGEPIVVNVHLEREADEDEQVHSEKLFADIRVMMGLSVTKPG